VESEISGCQLKIAAAAAEGQSARRWSLETTPTREKVEEERKTSTSSLGPATRRCES
jgi:hypothetical protein